MANHEHIIELVASGDAKRAEAERKERILSSIPLILEDFEWRVLRALPRVFLPFRTAAAGCGLCSTSALL